MPPQRRRRPVQPATRVRLPRAARPRTTPDPDELIAGAPGENGAVVTEPAQPSPAEPSLAQPSPAEPEPGPATEAAPEREPLLVPVCLGVVAVALGGLAVWFGLNSGGTAGAASGFGTSAGNVAVTDTAATAEVKQQIDSAVNTIFSYNYADTAKTANAAKSLLTGRASQEYATLFKVVQQQAPSEKLVLTTTVTNSGVEMLNAYSARLLIFANQQDTGAAKGSTTDAGAMFAVTAVRQDGRWKIENINTFSAPG